MEEKNENRQGRQQCLLAVATKRNKPPPPNTEGVKFQQASVIDGNIPVEGRCDRRL